ncbi:MAG TPA: hypothetical protein VM141_10290 [Planctomycetota bacterium]|nr:hypothetical protein [Planctomycetota bacterium]
MKRAIACTTATVLAAASAWAASLDDIGLAVKLQGYRATKRACAQFMAQVLPEYRQNMPDGWLTSALGGGGVESIDQQGEYYLLLLQTPQAVASVLIVPLVSSDYFLDSLRGSLGPENQVGGTFVFTEQVPLQGGGHAERSLHARLAGRTAIISEDRAACEGVASLHEKGGLKLLFEKTNGGLIEICAKGSFVARHSDSICTWTLGMPLTGMVMAGSPDLAGWLQFHLANVLAAAEQAEEIYIGLAPRPSGLTLQLTVFPCANTPLAIFLAQQKPMRGSLLSMIPGEPVFAAAGRVESLAELEAAYPEHAAQQAVFAQSLGRPAGNPASVRNREAERLSRFRSVFAGSFAAALVQPPLDAYSHDYLRAYEVADLDRAKENIAWEMSTWKTADGAAAVAIDEAEHAGCSIYTWQIKRPRPAVDKLPLPDYTCAAFTDKYMLLASGAGARVNIRKMIDLCRNQSDAAVNRKEAFAKAFAGAGGKTAAPRRPAAVLFFSLTGAFNLISHSGKPAMENLRMVQAPAGVAAWIVPQKDGSLSVTVHIPVEELTEPRKTILGDLPLLELPAN